MLFLAASAAPVTPSENSCELRDELAKEAAKVVANLTVQLYRKIANSSENSIFSPVSIALALALVESGADGGTRNEIQNLLLSTGSNQTSATDAYQPLQRQLQIQGENVKLSIANGLFYSDSVHLKKEYLNKIQQCFQTEVSEERFSQDPEQSRKRINQWVSKATAQKIPELFKSGSIGPETMAMSVRSDTRHTIVRKGRAPCAFPQTYCAWWL